MSNKNENHQTVPLSMMLKRELANEKVERPEILDGQASQSKKGEDFMLVKTECQRVVGDGVSTYSVFGTSLLEGVLRCSTCFALSSQYQCERDLDLLHLPPSLPLVVSSTSQPCGTLLGIKCSKDNQNSGVHWTITSLEKDLLLLILLQGRGNTTWKMCKKAELSQPKNKLMNFRSH